MSQHFKITRVLSTADSAELHARFGRSETLDESMQWLKGRGYKNISRSALGNYRKAHLDASAWPMAMKLGILGDASARTRLRSLAAKLDGRDLAQLAMFASFLVACRSSRRAERENRPGGHSGGGAGRRNRRA